MSFYRNVVWYTRGLKQYTKKGYEAASQNFNSTDFDVDLSERSIMITGANSGIGKCCAVELAKLGATIHMVCRNKERGEAAMKEIIEASKNEKIHLLELDLGKPKDVVKFARSFEDSGKPLHVLINNAGCMVNERTLDSDGLEANFATNTLGTFILTELLLPTLKKSGKSRVVVVSSGGMLVQKLDYDDLQFSKMSPFDGTLAYAQNKRQQVVMVEEWAKQHQDIHFSSMHPGWADTPAVAMSMPKFYNKMQNKLRTPLQGADTAIWLAASESAVQLPSGGFYQDRTIVEKHLPLAWTKSSVQDQETFMSRLNELMKRFV